ncbi:MAG: Type II secretion system protein E [Candidatus Azambacteria bacterium GW2011_GWB2_46_37]|uniref:Type II secretion system protein E n=1 Tax=Candidatus Azambacteria bacterium GW2011_GWB2_46_37 TaxID=1618618 RepID=A0A0G1PXW5_9BACT|nr:MAG: Type II secretion system protein E [Candidatus Azambacteria bacterium GW2011_GWB2_46_37]
MPLANLKERTPDPKNLALLPESLAKEKRVVVFEKEPGLTRVAMEDPADLETIEYLKQKLGGEIEPYLATPSDLRFAFKIYKKDIAKEFKKIIEENIAQTLTQTKEGKDLERLAENMPVISMVDNIVEYATISNASDIFFERSAEGVTVRYRIDGILRDIVAMPKEVHPGIIARIKILAALKIDEHRAPQDGRFKFKAEEQPVDIRVSIMPTFYGEKAVMRLLRSSARPLNLTDLGILNETRIIVEENITKTHGMVLVTGPTGSGKTTTLYALLQILNKPEVSISTIEDPIEYDIQGISQTQVNPRANITFANGLRSLMRQNPDIIMVGEIRDNETADIAINSALTGHLMLSTLHTNDAISAIPRFLDLGIPAFLISSTLNVIGEKRN